MRVSNIYVKQKSSNKSCYKFFFNFFYNELLYKNNKIVYGVILCDVLYSPSFHFPNPYPWLFYPKSSAVNADSDLTFAFIGSARLGWNIDMCIWDI